MNIEGTLRKLGPVNSGPLIEAVLAQDETAFHAIAINMQKMLKRCLFLLRAACRK